MDKPANKLDCFDGSAWCLATDCRFCEEREIIAMQKETNLHRYNGE